MTQFQAEKSSADHFDAGSSSPIQSSSANALAVQAGPDPFDALLAFDKELVAASPKVYNSGMALVKSANVYEVMVEDLQVLEDFNPRIRNADLDAHIESLTHLILANGFLRDKPLAVIAALKGKKPVFYITDGHCRFEAVKRAIERGSQIESLPVVVKDQSTTMEDLAAEFAFSNHTRKLTPLEKAVVCKRLVTAGWSYAKIGDRLQLTGEYVGQLMKIIGSPRAVRDAVQNGQLSMRAALELLREHGDGVVDALTQLLSPEKKATAKDLPSVRRENAYKRFSPQMYSTLNDVCQHEAFKHFPDDLKTKVLELIGNIEQKCTAKSSGKSQTKRAGKVSAA